MSLARLEALFWKTARGQLDERAVRRAFCSEGSLDAVERMAIYRDMYFVRQIEALRMDFPLLGRELGEATFRDLARAYVFEHPSEAPALEWVGRRFPSYLSQRGLPLACVELASLEWLACAALLAPREPAASAADVTPAAWPQVRIHLSRSLDITLVSRAVLARFLNTSSHGKGSTWVAVWRQGFGVRSLPVAEDEAQAIRLARASRPFAQVCSAFNDVSRAYEVVRGWFTRKWISQLEV